MAQLEMLERMGLDLPVSVTQEITGEAAKELMKRPTKYTLMGLPVIVYHDAANIGYVDLCLNDDVIARLECLAVPMES